MQQNVFFSDSLLFWYDTNSFVYVIETDPWKTTGLWNPDKS